MPLETHPCTLPRRRMLEDVLIKSRNYEKNAKGNVLEGGRSTMENTRTIYQQTTHYTKIFDKEIKVFDLWVKNMNYLLFLEHTHSNEYYARNKVISSGFGMAN